MESFLKQKHGARNASNSSDEAANVFRGSLRGITSGATKAPQSSSGTSKSIFSKFRKSVNEDLFQPPSPASNKFSQSASSVRPLLADVGPSSNKAQGALKIRPSVSNSNICAASLKTDDVRPYNFRSSNNQLTGNPTSILEEVDFVSHLWNTLIPSKGTNVAFSVDSMGNYSLTSGYKLEENFEKQMGQNCVTDILSRCSDARKKLCAMEQFVVEGDEPQRRESPYSGGNSHNDTDSFAENMYSSPFNLPIFSGMLGRPIRFVLKEFLENMKTKVNEAKVHRQDVRAFSDAFVHIEPDIEKVYKFFAPLLPSMNIPLCTMHISPREPAAEKINFIWSKYIDELNTCADLDEDLPNGQKLFIQLVHILGEYFDVICQAPQTFNDFLMSPLSANKSGSMSSLATINVHCPMTGDSVGTRHSSVEDLFSSATFCNNNSLIQSKNSLPFERLCTDKVKENLCSALRFSNKVKMGAAVSGKGGFSHERSFSEVYNEVRAEIAKQESERSHFNFLVALMERSSFLYKKQFTDFIFNGIHENHKLEIALYQIKELYTLKAFAHYMPASNREFVAKNCYTTFDWVEEMNKALTNLLRNTDIQAARMFQRQNSEKNNNDNAGSSELGFVSDSVTESDGIANPNNFCVEILDDRQPWQFVVTSNLEWPLSCVLTPALYNALNKCLEECQMLFQLRSGLLALSEKSSTLGLTWQSLASRRKRYLARNNLEIITVIYATARHHLESLIDVHSTQIIKAKTVEEIEGYVCKLTKNIETFLDGSPLNGSSAHNAVESLRLKVIGAFYAAETGYDLSTTNVVDAKNTSSLTRSGGLSSSISPQTPFNRRNSQSTSNLFDSIGRSPLDRSGLLTLAYADNDKMMRWVNRWLKRTENARMLVSAAAKNLATTIDHASVAYSIAIQLDPSPTP